LGSALLTFMLFLGVMLILRSVLFGVIPHIMNKRKSKKKNDDPDGEQG
jgi:hypothetical protein